MIQKITIWDTNVDRLRLIQAALKITLKKLNIIAIVQINCEPPLLSRYNLIGKTPVIQINNGDFWSLNIGKVLTEAELTILFLQLKKSGDLK